MTTFSKSDIAFMEKAINLARKGEGLTSPNPMVGAVLVKDGKIIAQDYHRKAGSAHAEALVIESAGSSSKGAALFVNLEPCNHFGKTPPCVDAILASGISRVVVAIKDPNPKVKGGGIEKLSASGIKVDVGLLHEKAAQVNEKYLYNVTTGLPFVIIKTAATLDGKIATKTGDSQWITTPKARKFAHLLRNSVDAVAIGSGTVIKDDPLLTVRLASKKTWTHRIIFDSLLKTSPDAKLFSEIKSSKLFFITTAKADNRQRERLVEHGAQIIEVVSDEDGHPAIEDALKALSASGVASILVEGGAGLIASFIKSGYANKLIVVYSPKLIGGKQAVPISEELGVNRLNDAYSLEKPCWQKFGEEMIFSGYFKKPGTII